MKKWLWIFFSMLVFPCIVSVIACMVSPDLSIGQGERTMRNCHMGKDILVELNGLYKKMDVEEYTLGILAGVIPPDYDMETLKMQAVIVRTNLLKEMEEQGTKDAEDLSFSYISVEDRKEMWGRRKYDLYEKRMERAVVDTAGKVLKKEGNLILACYHEVSIGKTASAKEILGEDISYLQSVESGWDVEAKHYMNLVNLTWEELNTLLVGDKEKMTSQEEQQELDGKTEEKRTEEAAEQSETSGKIEIQITESTENGFVKKVKIADKEYTGEDIMKLLELPSLNFYVEEQENGIRFVCLGKGNNLGVSQYGANCMAIEGKSMEEILQYYYQDVSLESY